MRKVDAVVLGAGIVGVSAAVHLLRRGCSVVLVDRRDPGEETSHGNAGVIERDGFVPIGFPDSLGSLVRYALNRTPEAHYHRRSLRDFLPWLTLLKEESTPAAIDRFARAADQLKRHAVAEHRALARAAQAGRYFRATGWLRLYRSAASFAKVERDLHYARIFGAGYDVLEADAVRQLEPHLRPVFHRAVHWLDSESVSSPGAVTKAYAGLFAAEGGTLLKGDALSLEGRDSGWMVATEAGRVWGAQALVALGPWSLDMLRPLGYDFPMAVKRGYHIHYRPLGGAFLSRPVVDVDNGYVLTPMERGIRLTTGIEFAERDAPPTPVQIARTKPHARKLFPIDVEVDPAPWMGARPCLPDSLPIIGRAPRHENLWLDFGHGHMGFTTGPVSGRLVADLMTGAKPLIDPAPYAASRFARI